MDEEARTRLAQLLTRHQGDRTVRKYALELRVSNTALQNWLAGSTLPSPKNLEKIAEFVGMSIEDLFTELNGEPRPSARKTVERVLQDALNLSEKERIRLIKLLLDSLNV